MSDFHFYEPQSGHRLPHDPLNAIVAPRPIGWISSLSADGVRNLAPYSFFNLINYRPPLIAFASSGWKDTVANVEATGEFVWNLATQAQAEAMNKSSASVASDSDEFDIAQLSTLPSKLVKPPRVAGSPVHFECRLTQLVRLENRDGDALDQWLRPLEEGLADLPELTCTPDGAARLRNGNPGMVIASGIDYGTEAWASFEGRAVAVGRYMGGELHPSRVFV